MINYQQNLNYDDGSGIFGEYLKKANDTVSPKAVKQVYNSTLDDINEFNRVLFGSRSPVKSLGRKIRNRIKDIFSDKEGIIEKMEKRVNILDYCISDVHMMKEVAENAYDRLESLVESNYDVLYSISTNIPSLISEAQDEKTRLIQLYERREADDTLPYEQITLGKEIFTGENAYKAKVNEVKIKYETMNLLANILKRNKNYASTLIDVATFYERSHVIGKAIRTQMRAHIETLKSGTMLAESANSLDIVSSDLMALSNQADKIWLRSCQKISGLSRSLEDKTYAEDNIDSLSSVSSGNLEDAKRFIDHEEKEIKNLFKNL
ncbi:MAG: hypothetical protein ACLFPQ_05505 [Candidatus Woesearchaeota archaeon]